MSDAIDIPASALSPFERAFRVEVRAFIETKLPAEIRARVASGQPVPKSDELVWHRLLAARGWIAPGWPADWGGCDWTPIQRYLFDEATVALDAPFINPFGLFRAAPVIYTFGSRAQQARYLPAIHSGEEWWCQGYSEPDAGSDLAALDTRATSADGGYLVTGRKLWTTNAHLADRMFTLVRTGATARRQEGISFLLIDLRSPGVTIRPIVTIDGRHHFNEVILDAVHVPRCDRVGEEGKAWEYSKFLLGFERFQIADVPLVRRLLARLRRIAAQTRRGGRALADDPLFAARVDAAEIALIGHARTTLRKLATFQSEGSIGPEVSMLKIRGSELRQQVMQLTMEALGPRAYAMDGGAGAAIASQFLYSRAASIFGGSNEIQRNLLAREMGR